MKWGGEGNKRATDEKRNEKIVSLIISHLSIFREDEEKKYFISIEF
jgi:hypothetical protein